MTEPPSPECLIHLGKDVRWHCQVCQQPLCENCGAIAFQQKVFCQKCVPDYEQSVQPRARKTPPLGVKIMGWTCIVPQAILWCFVATTIIGHFGFGVPMTFTTMDGKPIDSAAQKLAATALFFLFGLLLSFGILLGRGLLMLRPWARWVYLLFGGLDIVYSIWLPMKVLYEKGAVQTLVLRFPITGVFLIWYFNRERIRKSFNAYDAARS